MPPEHSPPDFESFARWVASRFGAPSSSAIPPKELVNAARVARDENSRATPTARPARLVAGGTRLEALTLLAAATSDDAARPPQLVTEMGFRVALTYEDGEGTDGPSICILVQCPADLIGRVEGGAAYLWIGDDRFELGQFDADGKAIGLLPAGVRVTLSGFSSGIVKLEVPDSATGD